MANLKNPFISVVLTIMSISLQGCGDTARHQAAYDDSAMIEAGYTRAPVISSIKAVSAHEVIVSGITMPDGRARFLNRGQAVGFTADSKGRFEARLPIEPSGTVYELQIEDRGRLVKAEGILFLPCCDASHSVLLRPGASSIALGSARSAISSVNVNGGQAIAVDGYVKPELAVTLYVNGVKSAQTLSDKQGRYEFLAETKSQVLQNIMIESGGEKLEKIIEPSAQTYAPDAPTSISETQQAWIINWGIVGGGRQTSIIYK